MDYCSDRSIYDPDLDAFGIAPFSRRLARIIRATQRSPNMVIGVNGSWGAGKSTAVNFAVAYLVAAERERLGESALDDAESAALAALRGSLPAASFDEAFPQVEQKHGRAEGETVVLRYNPWLVSGHETLISDYFRLLGERAAELLSDEGSRSALRKAALEVARFVENAGGVAEAVFDYLALSSLVADPSGGTAAGSKVAGWIAGKIADVAGRVVEASSIDTRPKTLQEAREQLKTLLAKTKKRFLVILDDIDRLEAREVKPLLSMVKSVGDLPGVTYLLGYEHRLLQQALDRADRRDQEHPSFLEKIIQIEVELPRIPGRRLERALLEWLPKLLGRDTTSDEQRDIETDLLYGRRMLETPRDFMRLRNNLVMVRAATGRELLITDVIRMELIRLKEPGLFDWLMRHQGNFSGRLELLGLWLDEQGKKDFFASGIERASAYRREACVNWLAKTLPEFQTIDNRFVRGARAESSELGWPLSRSEGWTAYTQLYPHDDSLTQDEWEIVNKTKSDFHASADVLLVLGGRKRSDGMTMISSLLEDLPRFVVESDAPSGLLAALLTQDQSIWVVSAAYPERAFEHLLAQIPASRRMELLRRELESGNVPLLTAARALLCLGRPYKYIWSYHRDRPAELVTEKDVSELAEIVAHRIETTDHEWVGRSAEYAPLLEILAKQRGNGIAYALGKRIALDKSLGALGLLLGMASRVTSSEDGAYAEFDGLKHPDIYPYSELRDFAAESLRLQRGPEHKQLFEAAVAGITKYLSELPGKSKNA